MRKHIIAIGGGGFGRSIGSLKIERYILNLSKKKRPRICFIPTATGDSDSYKLNFYKAFSRIDCRPSHIDLFKRTINLKKHIEKQDVVYVGGGNTKSMLGTWKEWNLDGLLKEAYNRGIIMSGVSAGAICWFEKGITDSWKNNLQILDCLGFIKGTCCPHYDEEKSRIPFVKRMLEKSFIDHCIALEGDCALHIENGKKFTSVSFEEGKNAYFVSRKDHKLISIPYKKVEI